MAKPQVRPAFAPTAHGGAQSVVFAPTIEFVTAKLTSLIRTNDHRVLGPSAPDRHRHGVQHQACLHARPHAPTNDRTRVQVKHGGQIHPPLMRADVGDVRYPLLVWLIMLELALQLVWGHLRRFAYLISGPLVAKHRFDLRCLHQPSNPIFATRHSRLLEIKEDAGLP